MDDLNGKVALVTGASRGLGHSIAVRLATAGADVVVAHFPTTSDNENANAVVREIQALNRRAVAVSIDVTDRASIAAALSGVSAQFKRIDILVNNAGVMQQSAGMETTAMDFDRCYAVNVKGVWHVTQELLPSFMKQGEGRIINISSGAGRRGAPDLPAYCASKAALISLTQSLAAALGPHGINVNAICPGVISTAMCDQFRTLVGQRIVGQEDHSDAVFRHFEEATPLRRLQTGDDVGSAVVFLASSYAKNITGQAINVDGGYFMN
jgi:NAD(P)-dependent dehydrogenase (short-subunit alcohol dehydrogenase family)